jgi:Ca2+-binding EF-hand superfamily protein
MKGQESAMKLLKFGILVCLLSMPLTATFAQDQKDEDKGYTAPSPEELIKRYDKNGNGKLSRSEKKAAVKGENIRRFDLNGDGKLNSKEKKRAKTALRREAEFEREVDKTLRRWDVNKDKVIDEDEVDRMEKVSRGGKGRGRGGWGGWNPNSWVEGADKDNDGEIDRKELREALKANDKKSDDWRKNGKDWRKKEEERRRKEKEDDKKDGDKKDGDKKDGDKKDGDKKDGDKKDGDKKDGDKKDDTGNSP